MPNPNRMWAEAGLWGKWELPNPAAVDVLRHLMEPGKPRLYIQMMRNGVRRGHTSNSESAPGFATKIDYDSLIEWDLVEIDEEATAACASSISAYRIAPKGREALVQVEAYAELEKYARNVFPKVLEQLREKYRN